MLKYIKYSLFASVNISEIVHVSQAFTYGHDKIELFLSKVLCKFISSVFQFWHFFFCSKIVIKTVQNMRVFKQLDI